MTPYYYIHRPGTPGPTVKHPTRAAAQTEAERLATKHPGVTFEILQCIGHSSTPVPTATTFWLDEAETLPKALVIGQQLRMARERFEAAVKAYDEAESEARSSFLEHNQASYWKGRLDALHTLVREA
jgi:hypothetical protein